MRFKKEIYATGKQCFIGILAAFIVAGIFLALHDVLWEWVCIAASFLFNCAGDVLHFIFPILPATCLVLTGFIFWLSCLTVKLSNMNKLTKTFWLRAVLTHFASLLILVGAFIAWITISNSGETLLKGVGTIGLIASAFCSMLISMCYDDQNIKPENSQEEAPQ